MDPPTIPLETLPASAMAGGKPRATRPDSINKAKYLFMGIGIDLRACSIACFGGYNLAD
jgi:hypothetical protein